MLGTTVWLKIEYYSREVRFPQIQWEHAPRVPKPLNVVTYPPAKVVSSCLSAKSACIPCLRASQSSGRWQKAPVGSTSPRRGSLLGRPNLERHRVPASWPTHTHTQPRTWFSDNSHSLKRDFSKSVHLQKGSRNATEGVSVKKER